MKYLNSIFCCLLILSSSCSNEDLEPNNRSDSITSIETKSDIEGEFLGEINNCPITADSLGRITQGIFLDDKVVSFSYSNSEILATSEGKTVKYYLNDSNLINRAEINQSDSTVTLTFEYSEDERLIKINNKSYHSELSIAYENGNFMVSSFEFSTKEPYVNTMLIDHTPFFFVEEKRVFFLDEILGCNILFSQGYFGKHPQNRIIGSIRRSYQVVYVMVYNSIYTYDYDGNGKLTSVKKITSSNAYGRTQTTYKNYRFDCEL